MNSRLKKHRIYTLLKRFDEKLLEYYLNEGPQELRRKLNVKSDGQWRFIMQYLVYEKDAVKLCVRKNTAYIHNFFAEHGPNVLRKVFDINHNNFDEAWEYVIDYLGVSRGALYEYITNNPAEFKKLVYNGESSKIRSILNIEKEKYNRVWNEILDILLESVTTEKFSFSYFEQGIRMFTSFYNKGRNHRSLKSFNEKKA
jgi:hypothetical protein